MEFIINEFITLKLEDGKTIIYVLGEEFIQCKYLLMTILVRDVGFYDEINSIDEVAEKLDKSLERGNPEAFKIEISPKVEFWGHCSNLQVWAEQNYDTRFIHSNLAFPLLKKLTEVGDLKARKVFKDEIGNRFEKGSDSVRQFLALGGYMDYLSREEMWSVIPNQMEAKALQAIEREVGAEFKLRSYEMDELVWGQETNQLAFSIKDNYTKEVWIINFKSLPTIKWKNIFGLLGKLSTLRELYLSQNTLRKIPENIGLVKSLEVLKIEYSKLEVIPEEIGELENLEWLILNNNEIKVLPMSIGKLRLLEELHINRNQLVELPDSIGSLESLKKLFLKNNRLKKLPDDIIRIDSLVDIALKNNMIINLPRNITEMKSLKGISLIGNKIEEDSPIIASLKKKGITIEI